MVADNRVTSHTALMVKLDDLIELYGVSGGVDALAKYLFDKTWANHGPQATMANPNARLGSTPSPASGQ
jgi:hypothetical protein